MKKHLDASLLTYYLMCVKVDISMQGYICNSFEVCVHGCEGIFYLEDNDESS